MNMGLRKEKGFFIDTHTNEREISITKLNIWKYNIKMKYINEIKEILNYLN